MATKKNVLSEAQLEEWKQEFHHIYKSTIGDTSIIWRKLRRKEYVEAMTQEVDNPATKIFDRQDLICKTCILFPEDVDDLIDQNGGLSGTIADEILMKSGFDISDTEEL